MMGQGLTEDIETDFFDHIDDLLLDFPNEDIGVDLGSLEGSCPAASDFLASSGSALSGHGSGGQSLGMEDDLAAELSVPCEDIAQLEWLSTFVEDSFSAVSIDLDNDYSNKSLSSIITHSSSSNNDNSNNSSDSQFLTSSPVSVLEGSSCSGKPMPLSPDTVFPGRARSKRPRPPSFTSRSSPIISPASSESSSVSSFLPEFKTFEEFHPQPPKKGPKKKQQLPPAPAEAGYGEAPQPAALVRKCMHCGIQKTPQWRMGPMGPKTLCNACGVRYKSGRLFPEYRPAASPTFVASLHSNSHKKVVEMRIKLGQKTPAPTPEFVRKTSHMLDCA